MANSEFILINKFRIDFLEFQLYDDGKGRYKTVCTDLETGAKSEENYKDFDQLLSVFSDELTKKELLNQ